MSMPTITISETAQRLLQALAGETGQSPTEVLEKALDQYRRQVFFEGLAADYAALRADSEAWAEELEERKLWDTTLMDGLEEGVVQTLDDDDELLLGQCRSRAKRQHSGRGDKQ